MFDQLNRVTNWNDETFPMNQLMLLRSNKTNGDFLVHHFLSLLLKQNYNISFVTLAQTFSHYAQAGAKIGSNLEAAKEQGNLNHFDLMELWMSDYTNEGAKLNFNFKSIYNEITANLHRNKGAVIIDDLTILLELGFDYTEVYMFIQYLVAFCKSQENCVVITHVSELNNSTLPLLNCLQRLSETVITAEALKSGYSKDVHGKLEIANRNYVTGTTIKSVNFQYKMTDKSVLLFAKGMSSAVL